MDNEEIKKLSVKLACGLLSGGKADTAEEALEKAHTALKEFFKIKVKVTTCVLGPDNLK
jgi:hypothetical protein